MGNTLDCGNKDKMLTSLLSLTETEKCEAGPPMKVCDTDPCKTQHLKMTTQPIPGLVIRLAIPTVISMLVTALYNTADTFFVSRLGTSASGAVGMSFP